MEGGNSGRDGETVSEEWKNEREGRVGRGVGGGVGGAGRKLQTLANLAQFG